MFIAAPQMKGNGVKCERVVQALNWYPTLLELCGLPPPPQGLEGVSMVPLLNDPKASWDRPAYTVWSEDGQALTGIGVRVEGWRYAEYDLGGAMLLDMTNDPHQLWNLAHDPKYADLTAKLAGLVQKYRDSAVKAPAASAA